MKTCSRCHKEFENQARRCPHCGAGSAASGLFQTSTVLISEQGTDRVYRSVEEVPAPLRNRLLKTTHGDNADTILIADRKGREEIDKAMRKLPGPARRRRFGAILTTEEAADPLGGLTPARRRWLGLLVLLAAPALVALLFLYR